MMDSPMRVTECRHAQELPPEWAMAVSRHYSYHPGSLQILAAFEPRYVLVWEGERAVAAASIYLVRAGGPPAPSNINLHHLLYRRRAVPGVEIPPRKPEDLLPMVVFGPLKGGGNMLVLDPALAAPARRKAVEELVRHARNVAAGEGAAVIAFPYLVMEDAREVSAALGSSAVPLFGVAQHFLPVPRSFDEYLASLGGKRGRVVRREQRLFREKGLECRVERLADCAADVSRLYAMNSTKYASMRAEDVERHVAEAVEAHAVLPPENVLVFTCSLGGERVGFTCYIRWGDTWYARMAGFADDRVEGAAAYFNVTYYEPLKEALAAGAAVVRLGPSSDETKLLRGSRIRPLSFVFDAAEGSPIAPLRDAMARADAARLRALAEQIARLGAYEGQARGDLADAFAFHGLDPAEIPA